MDQATRPFELWAAVDVLDGQCVQLKGGDPDTARFSQDPLRAAQRWAQRGADGIHLVDLNAALGTGENASPIETIVNRIDLPVQLGGGIGDERAIERWLKRGVKRVVVGTRGVNDPGWLERMALQFPRRVVLAVDARGDEVTVSGWTRGSGINLFELAASVEGLALAGLLYTNVGIEGSLNGIDPRPVRRLCGTTRLPVWVSGGVKCAKDVRTARQLGAAGVVLGTALYAGKVDLSDPSLHG